MGGHPRPTGEASRARQARPEGLNVDVVVHGVQQIVQVDLGLQLLVVLAHLGEIVKYLLGGIRLWFERIIKKEDGCINIIIGIISSIGVDWLLVRFCC